jgi:hypothetical protein
LRVGDEFAENVEEIAGGPVVSAGYGLQCDERNVDFLPRPNGEIDLGVGRESAQVVAEGNEWTRIRGGCI